MESFVLEVLSLFRLFDENFPLSVSSEADIFKQNTAARCLTGLCYDAQMRFNLLVWLYDIIFAVSQKKVSTLQLTERRW